jgi:hypothetical protein
MDPTAPKPQSVTQTLETLNVPRLFSYTTASFMLGAVTHMLSSGFLPFTLYPAGIGWVVMALYGAAYATLARTIAKRYLRKTRLLLWFPYLLGALMVLPPAIQVVLQGDFPDPLLTAAFILILFIGTQIGSKLGISS